MTISGQHRGLVLAVLALTGLLLGACALTVDPDEARLCRMIAAGLEGGNARLSFGGARSTARTATANQGPSAGVALTYASTARDGVATSGAKSIACLFDPSRPSAAVSERLISVETDAGPMAPARLYMLKRFWLATAEGIFADPEPVPGAHAAWSVSRPLAVLLQALLAGLPQMALLSLLAAAYGLVYGLVGRINLAFGDLVVVGGYAGLIGVAAANGPRAVAAPILAALLLALWAAMSVGAAAGRFVFEPLNARSGQVALIASAGLSIVLAEGVRLAKAQGPRSGPPILNAPYAIARSGDFIVTVTPMALLVALLGLIGVAAVLVGLARSGTGRAWRAAADDPLAAALMGVSPTAIHLATFAVAGLLAGLGGAIAAIAYGSAAYASGLVVGLKALIAALLGGAGSVRGAALCGLGIGVIEALWSAALPIEHREAMLFTLLVTALVLRPGGLFGTPELEPRR